MTTVLIKSHAQATQPQLKSLSQSSSRLLKKLLFTLAKQEQSLELGRQFLASNDNTEPYSLFQRIDRNQDGFISPMELLNFLRDNGTQAKMTEADCYYVVKYFDSDDDGKLQYQDFMQMVLPCENEQLRAKATQRPLAVIKENDYLTLDVERELTKLLVGEITLHRRAEKLKQQLESCADYSAEALYSIVDDWGYGYVDTSNLKSFFRKYKYKATD